MTHQDDMLAFLRAQHTGAIEHSSADLLSHLLGVQALLKQWGARPAVSDAGLFHSVYGTEHFTEIAVPQAMRPEVRALIGEEAEALAHAFATMDRESLYDNLFSSTGSYFIRSLATGESEPITEQQFLDLCNLTVANWAEQRLRVPAEMRYLSLLELEHMRPYLLAGARNALNEE